MNVHQEPIQEHFQAVTVMFADIAGTKVVFIDIYIYDGALVPGLCMLTLLFHLSVFILLFNTV